MNTKPTTLDSIIKEAFARAQAEAEAERKQPDIRRVFDVPNGEHDRYALFVQRVDGLRRENGQWIPQMPGTFGYVDAAEYAYLHGCGAAYDGNAADAQEVRRYLLKSVAPDLEVVEERAEVPAVSHARADAAAEAKAKSGRDFRPPAVTGE
jgi:hypothetical protein